MKKLVLALLLVFMTANVGMCDLSADKINVYNLKKSNMYLLDLSSKAEKIDVSDTKILNVTPVTSLEADGKQLFIEANGTGVCDVKIKTQKDEYKVRFVTGNVFEEEDNGLVLVDLPIVFSKEI